MPPPSHPAKAVSQAQTWQQVPEPRETLTTPPVKPGPAGDSSWAPSHGTFPRAPCAGGRDAGKNPCSPALQPVLNFIPLRNAQRGAWGRLGQRWPQPCPPWGHHEGLKLTVRPTPRRSGIQQVLKAQLFGGCRSRRAGERQSGEQGSICRARMRWLRIKPEGFCGGEDQECFPETPLSSWGQWRACQILSRHVNASSSK